MIFHCGNSERIAFRHRGSQVLYISDLIDIPRCKDPGYGKIHIGLYMSIMHDVLDRTRQQSEQDHITKSKKRRRGDDARSNSKRPRTRALAAKLLADEIEHEKSCDVCITPRPPPIICLTLSLVSHQRRNTLRPTPSKDVLWGL